MTTVNSMGSRRVRLDTPAATFASEKQRQAEAAERRARERAAQRREHVDALAGPGGIAAVETPERIAKRLDRLTRYYTGEDVPQATPPQRRVSSWRRRSTG